MGNIIGEVLAAFSALIVVLLAYSVFGDLINNVLTSFVQDALMNPTGSLIINANALYLTLNIILMGFKLFCFFVTFGIFARLFVYCGFLTEEQGVY